MPTSPQVSPKTLLPLLQVDDIDIEIGELLPPTVLAPEESRLVLLSADSESRLVRPSVDSESESLLPPDFWIWFPPLNKLPADRFSFSTSTPDVLSKPNKLLLKLRKTQNAMATSLQPSRKVVKKILIRWKTSRATHEFDKKWHSINAEMALGSRRTRELRETMMELHSEGAWYEYSLLMPIFARMQARLGHLELMLTVVEREQQKMWMEKAWQQLGYEPNNSRGIKTGLSPGVVLTTPGKCLDWSSDWSSGRR